MAKRGRKNKYESHVAPQLKRIPAWRKQGMTEEQVAKKCGIAYSTLNEYKNKYPELMEALQTGKEELVENLESSLYKVAIGYEYEETEIIGTRKANGKETVTKFRKTKKTVPPNVGALCFSLINLAPDKWKDKRAIEHSGSQRKEVALVDINDTRPSKPLMICFTDPTIQKTALSIKGVFGCLLCQVLVYNRCWR